MSTHPGLDLSWITDNLAVGGRIPPGQEPALRRLGIDCVVDVRSEDCDDARALQRAGIAFYHLPTPDCQPLSPEAMRQGVHLICERLAAGQRVLIHCQHGVGRSVLLACAVLMHLTGCSSAEALDLVRARRPQAAPNPQQVAGLRLYEALRQRARSARDLLQTGGAG